MNRFGENDAMQEIPCVDVNESDMTKLGYFVMLEEFSDRSVKFARLIDGLRNRELMAPRVETEGKFKVSQEKGMCFASMGVGSERHDVAKVDQNDSYKFYFRELNYHPDASHIIVPEEESPFVMVLGQTPHSLKAYVFDGSKGFEINPGVWYQLPILMYTGELYFRNKHSSTRMYVPYDSVEEDKYWLTFNYI